MHEPEIIARREARAANLRWDRRQLIERLEVSLAACAQSKLWAEREPRPRAAEIELVPDVLLAHRDTPSRAVASA